MSTFKVITGSNLSIPGTPSGNNTIVVEDSSIVTAIFLNDKKLLESEWNIISPTEINVSRVLGSADSIALIGLPIKGDQGELGPAGPPGPPGADGKMYDSLAEAQAVDPKPANDTIFQVRDSGYYTFQSGSQGGTRFEREFPSEKEAQRANSLINEVVDRTYTSIGGTFTTGALRPNGSTPPNPAQGETYYRTSATSTTSMFNVVEGEVHTYTGEIHHKEFAGVLFVDINLAVIGYACNDIQVYDRYQLNLPAGTKYIAACSKGVNPQIHTQKLTLNPEKISDSLSFVDKFIDIEKTVTTVKSSFGYGFSALEALTVAGALTQTGINQSYLEYFRTSRLSSNTFNVKENTPYAYTGEIAHATLVGVIFLDADFVVLGITCNTIQVYNRFEFITPAGTKYIASCSKGAVPIIEELKFSIVDGSVAYVDQAAATGGTGSQTSPFNTINQAIGAKAKTIVISAGDYRETLDLGNLSAGTYELTAKEGAKVRVLGSQKLTNWVTTGSPLVYKTTFDTVVPSWNRYASPIFEDGNPSHPINSEERHPLQKSLSHRLPFTPIYQVGSINEVVNNPGTYHQAGNVLYIHTTNSDNPNANGLSYEVAIRGFNSVPTAQKDITLRLTGLQFMFGSNGLTFHRFKRIERYHCTVLACRGAGAFRDDTGDVLAYYDESGYCDNDGVNGHFSAFSGYISLTDHRSMSPHSIYFEPWTHDNYDDGISHHENHNVLIYGGLSEYNGDGGIRASNDSGYIVDRFHSRKNGWDTGIGEGIAVVNPTMNPNRNGCKMVATNCLLEDNAVGVSTLSNANNVIEIINCTLRNNGVELSASLGKIISRNCRVTNSDPTKIKVIVNGTIEVINDETLV